MPAPVSLALLLLLGLACAGPTFARTARVDLSQVREVWISTAEEMLGARNPWHPIRDPEAVRRLLEALAEARQTGRARMPYPQLDGTLTLIVGPERGVRTRYYGLRYDLKGKRLLDLHTGAWYAFPPGLEELLTDLLARVVPSPTPTP